MITDCAICRNKMDQNDSEDVEMKVQGEQQSHNQNIIIAAEEKQGSSGTAQAKPQDKTSEKPQSEEMMDFSTTVSVHGNISTDSAEMPQTSSQCSGGASEHEKEISKTIFSDKQRRAILKDDVVTDDELTELDNVMKTVERSVDGRCKVLLLFELLNKACDITIRILRPIKAFQTFDLISSLLTKYFAIFNDIKTPTTKESNFILATLEGFRKHTENLKGVQKIHKAQIIITFYIHSSLYLHAIRFHWLSHENIKKARKLLEHNFRESYKITSLFGCVSYQIARYNFVLKRQDVSNMALKQSFDAYFSVHTSSSSCNHSLVELYCFSFTVYLRNEGMLSKTVQKYISKKLETIYKTTLPPLEKFLSVSVRLWLSSSLAMYRNQTFKKHQRALLQIEFEIPPYEISQWIFCVLRTLVEGNFLPNDVEFKKKLFRYFKDVCLREQNQYEKFYQLNILALVIIKSETFSFISNNYLDIFKSVLFEMSKGTVCTDCAWMNERLCNVHIYTSFLYMDIVDYVNSNFHSDKVIELISSYHGKYEENLHVLKAIAHYICAFIHYNTKEYKEAQEHLDKEILLLKVVQPSYSECLQIALQHKAFLIQRETASSIPKALLEIYKVFPEPKRY